MQHVRDSFSRQKAMTLIGASLSAIEAGASEVSLPYRADLTQQKGYVHGGIKL
jgi:acyl-coenzyme A thioesterase PaaI-like protein